ncbi:hypothetical protein BD414DRAFT_477823 [Trametes punicea]|nr:hypothetical protein BD414DRAFT_504212 [Trametes punicea]KAI8996400.1 hypothetical protein BD414DRAFT_477823 [Trametes punicea]
MKRRYAAPAVMDGAFSVVVATYRYRHLTGSRIVHLVSSASAGPLESIEFAKQRLQLRAVKLERSREKDAASARSN